VKLISSVLLRYYRTKNLIESPDGKHLYAAVGSNSNAAENGLDKEDRRASILEIDVRSGQCLSAGTAIDLGSVLQGIACRVSRHRSGRRPWREIAGGAAAIPASAPKHSRGTRRPNISSVVAFKVRVRAMGIGDRPTSFRSPWQRRYAEHLIGSIRRDLVGFNAEHLRRILAKYAAHYNEVRTHVSLGKDAPCARPIERWRRCCASDQCCPPRNRRCIDQTPVTSQARRARDSIFKSLLIPKPKTDVMNPANLFTSRVESIIEKIGP
jgi:Integrase core domain